MDGSGLENFARPAAPLGFVYQPRPDHTSTRAHESTRRPQRMNDDAFGYGAD